ncbi:BTB/POZ domain-containing protein FBL11 isoform X3 [Pistacia vera]|uniref:BTB/POZ domain-containing protein FBL11 isoform X3 n=1 Tax=Pistacia vera TaxID=55513 RepID=UPI001263625B|nr:BTB/POZ domain-containing protein FBL11 isoform X3 [Pistacia vera]
MVADDRQFQGLVKVEVRFARFRLKILCFSDQQSLMASSSGDDFVILVCTNLNPIEVEAEKDREILISTDDIQSWDLVTILRYQTVRIRAYRNRLTEQSSYFHGLLGGSFSESSLDNIVVQWNLETFLNILQCIYGCPLNVALNNFLPLFEGALYFGVEMLLEKCRAWFSEVFLSKNSGPPQIQCDDLIHMWNFGLENANDFVPELCARYLARNFMWAMSNRDFVNIPFNLLFECVKHPCLTVDSEMHLSDALLVWLDANTEQMDCSIRTKENLTGILKEIRISILPLWFAAGKRRSCYFSKLADESVDSILRLVKIPPTGLINALGDVDLNHLRIRLTEYSEEKGYIFFTPVLNETHLREGERRKKVDFSSCPQVTSAILLLSVLHSSHSMDSTLRKIIKKYLINLEHPDKDHWRISECLPPTLSFEALQEVNISKCHRLHLEYAIECFSRSFPSLKTIKAAYLLSIKTTSFIKLVHKCPLVSEVDLSVDISPIIPTQVSVLSSNLALPLVSNKCWDVTSCYHSGTSLSNITYLTIEGRTDICDSDLEFISKYCVSLGYLNIKGCIAVTDVGISNVICRCIELHSIVVCDTSFGMNSILALCSAAPKFGNSTGHFGKRASNLQKLHMGCCKGVDETSLIELMSQTAMLKSLCLSDTHLVDEALYNFSGSSLELLDVSNTMISGAALAHIIRGNSGLKHLHARGCKYLFQQGSYIGGTEFSFSHPCKDLFFELGRTCKLEGIALGWGFSNFSLEALKPAIISLKSIAVGLGGTLGEDALRLLPTTCPMLEFVILHFQVISDSIMDRIMTSLKQLRALSLCYCLGDMSISSFKFSLPNLRKLRLDRVTPWMTNDDLVILIQHFANLVELSLLGCTLLNADSQLIISQGWPGLISIHLEGPGIPRNFILDASEKMPMLRKISLDMCDARDGDFDIPDYVNRYFLSSVTLARCLSEARRQPVHKKSLVLVWNSNNVIRTVVKERL